MAVAPFMNATVPVGITSPGVLEATVDVRVTGEFWLTGLGGEEVRVVVVSALVMVCMNWGDCVEDPAKVPWPE
jgi:hypothetical protein